MGFQFDQVFVNLSGKIEMVLDKKFGHSLILFIAQFESNEAKAITEMNRIGNAKS